jgi:Anaphase-promoting complex APC subunit CDC26
MLRRPPTLITLSSEDIALFDENRRREAEKNARAVQQQSNQKMQQSVNSNGPTTEGSSVNGSPSNQKTDPNDELRPLPGDKARIVRTRDERLGISGSRRL